MAQNITLFTDDQSSDVSAQLNFEIRKLDLIYQEHIKGVVTIVGNALGYTYISWEGINHTFLFSWLILLFSTATIRLFSLYRWNRGKSHIRSQKELKFWLRLLYSQLFMSGIGWGAIGFLAPTQDSSVQIITSLIIASMTAGPLIYYVSSRIAMVCITAPALWGWALGYLFMSDMKYHALLGFLILFYCVLLFFIGLNLNRAILRMISLDSQLKENEQHLRMALSSSDALSWDWNVETNSMRYNGNLSLFADGPDQLREILQDHLAKGQDIDTEVLCLDDKGNPRHVAIRGKVSRTTGDKAFRVSGIAWDITMKRNEEILRRERDLHEAANRGKSVLLANASHEIRTPIASILGYSEALLRSEVLDEQNRRDVEAIYRQGKFMVNLVNDLLDLSKIESSRLYFQSAPMNPVREIEDSVAMMRSTSIQKTHKITLKFETEFPEKIYSDPVRFRQVILNLLSNAVKFTSEGTIDVRAQVQYVDDDKKHIVRVVVTDTGMGMDSLVQKNLFEPFMRGENPEVQRVPGSGLGLALSRQLARGMGGDLRLIYSTLGKGSSFEFLVPLGDLSGVPFVSASHEGLREHEKIQVAKESGILTGRRVLVVDDSEDLRALMARYIMREGAFVETADHGMLAVEKALKQEFDVVLMDIKMPVMDGYQATALLRDQGYLGPIIAVTAQATSEGQQDSETSGFDAYLGKPVDISLLKSILSKL
ncbi:MAG: ATP-binding protein [Bacillota bacterium]